MPAVRKTKIMELFWKIHPWIYEKSGGRIGGTVMGMPVLVLMTRGRKSGLLRKNTLMYVPKGEASVVIASNAGEPNHPAWYLNLKANPNVQVLRGSKLTDVVARDAEGDERAALWKEIVAAESGYAEYERRTDRKIPVVILDP
ncbi:MAG: nitroreductase family deazaflavin-dependent oxidoreductase [Myxococcota bacterium]